MPVSPVELLIVLAIVLVIFGPKRLPGLGRQLGGGLREFKESLTGGHDDHEDVVPARTEVRPAEPARPPAEPAPAAVQPDRAAAPAAPAPDAAEQERREAR